MPIYEYRCQACGDEFEIIQKISDRPLARCGRCGGKLEKLLSRTAFLLKGGGWYADGYGGSGKGSARPEGAATAGKPAKSEKPAASGGDSKASASD
jgi:putative FmdB family regulatory protein